MEIAVNSKVLYSRTLQSLYYIKKTELKVSSPIFTRVNIRVNYPVDCLRLEALPARYIQYNPVLTLLMARY